MTKAALAFFSALLLTASVTRAQEVRPEETSAADTAQTAPCSDAAASSAQVIEGSCATYGPETPPEILDRELAEVAVNATDDLSRAKDSFLDKLTAFAEKHRLVGEASYYSTFFDGRKTANGEIYRNASYSAAHRTLPLGCWVEITSKATGRTIRLRVNDRGPFKGPFVIDLSQSAARALGVDRAADRRVDIRVIALPGEEPPAEVMSGRGEEKQKTSVAAAQ